MLPQEDLHSLLAQKKTTAKAVKDLLHFPEEMTALQLTVSRYLKRYIGETDPNTLKLFLRFCTGGSDLVDQAIHVEFIETTDFFRSPQSHTCGCILKLPIGYHSYPDFRCEFNNILSSSMWVWYSFVVHKCFYVFFSLTIAVLVLVQKGGCLICHDLPCMLLFKTGLKSVPSLLLLYYLHFITIAYNQKTFQW